MYNGYTSNAEQDRARWELMQKNAQRRAQQNGAQRTASRQPPTPKA